MYRNVTYKTLEFTTKITQTHAESTFISKDYIREYFQVYIREWYPVECLLTDARHWKLLEHDKAKLPRQPRLSRSTVGMFKNSNWMCLWNNEVQFNLYLNATPSS